MRPDDLWRLIDERGSIDPDAEPDRASAATDALRLGLADLGTTVRLLRADEPAEVRRQVIEGEGVHPIGGDDELDRRLAPDRRIAALTLPGDDGRLLAFVEVALTHGIASSIDGLLRAPVKGPSGADSATYYSINSPHPGLAGLRLGRVLITGAVAAIDADTGGLGRHATLSPMPRFRAWLTEREPDLAATTDGTDPEVLAAAARYLTDPSDFGRLHDPVGNFHVGNGAEVARLCVGADRSDRGWQRSWGLMVNYRYDLARLDERAMAYRRGRVAAEQPLPVSVVADRR